jgi:hypothetical protein
MMANLDRQALFWPVIDPIAIQWDNRALRSRNSHNALGSMPMSFKMDCPRCTKPLTVSERAIGKLVHCPGCKQPITIAKPAQPLPQANSVAEPPLWSGAAQNGHAMPDTAAPLPPRMPPMPSGDGTVDFLNRSTNRLSDPQAISDAVQGLKLADMFLGKEKEEVFQLLPDEDVLEEVTIRHKHFLIVDRGITRVTLTSQRLLYTKSRVFSPLYWLLVALFYPLIFYYVFRIARNRSGSFSLSSVDSVEKRYLPNAALFVLMLIVGFAIIGLFSVALKQLVGNSTAFLYTISYILDGLLSVGLLILLLTTRGPWMEIRTGNNRFPISRRPGDIGGDEEELDKFFQKVNIEVHRAKMLALRTSSLSN